MTQPQDHRDQPFRASDPERSVWVSAHAGSGKTHVLTNRVMRLLLAGVAPQRILCLTFTKAAAAEMTARLHKRLGQWAILPDDKLAKEISALEGEMAQREKLIIARRLFARTLETSQGLRIQTIHAFCQSVLKRFPIEAGIPPSFRVTDDPAARQMMAEAQNIVLTAANQNIDPLKTIVRDMNDAIFKDIFNEIISEKRELDYALPDYQKNIEALAQHWGISRGDDYETLRQKIADERYDSLLNHAANVLRASDNNTDRKRSIEISQQLQERDPVTHLERYIQIFITKDNKPRKNLITKHCEDSHPGTKEILLNEQKRVFDLIEKSNAVRSLKLSAMIASLAKDFLTIFSRLKTERNLLDYDDLITKTKGLFKKRGMEWVLYRMDNGLDHILIDEAQDINPEQWDIIEFLTKEFFAGQGAREDREKRTLFAVGDPKQSIFSFQGVVPDKFSQMQETFEQKTREAQKKWENVELERSFRSLPRVLELVDHVFENTDKMNTGVSHKRKNFHIAHRNYRHMRGHTEIWPQFEGEDGAACLARTIAEKIVNFIGDKHAGIKQRDIMILVRRRNVFVKRLIDALEARGLLVAGSDRLQLGEHLAIMDMISLAKFVLLPEDDLSLAEILKSPLGNLSEDQLMELALARLKPDGKDSLWAELCRRKETYPRVHDFLSDALRRADFVPVFEFFSETLEVQNMRAHFVAALGPEVNDPLDEFLNLALAYEKTQTSSLQGFIHWLAQTQVEVKRDMERSHDEIRIMTVHSAKGLEAKIVFLVDIPPSNPSCHWMPIEIDQQNKAPFWRVSDMPFQKVHALRDQNKIKENYEENRLLYVAMTRARDRLYVCGYHKKGEKPLRWLPLIAPHGNITDPPEIKETETSPAPPSNQEKHSVKIPPKVTIAAKLNQKKLSPSDFRRAQEPEADATISLLAPEPAKTAALSGSLMHEALRRAPQMSEKKLSQLLQRLFPQNAEEECLEMARLAHELMAKRDIAFCFKRGLAEVPVEALFGDQGTRLILSGRIDRLIFDEKNRTAQIIDYKTDKNPPDQIPVYYRKQLAAYRVIIQKIRPGWEVSAALLWTRIPRIDWADNNELDYDAEMIISNERANLKQGNTL